MPVKKQDPTARAVATDLRSLGQADTPAAAGVESRIIVAPNDPFFLRHHPGQWELVDLDGSPVYLPLLGRQSVTPGVDGMATARAGMPADDVWSEAQYVGTRDGWTYLDPMAPIPAACLPAGLEGGYRRRYPAQHPKSRALVGWFHAEAWSLPVATVPGRPQRWEYDRPTFARYRAWLVESGVIAAPIASVVADLRAAAEARLDRVESLTGVDAASHDRMIAKRRAALDRHDAAQVPA